MTAGSMIAAVRRGGDRWCRRPFSIGRVSFCLLPLLALALWIVALSSLATAGGTATAASPARISVPVPAAARTSSVVMLELSVSVLRKAAPPISAGWSASRARPARSIEVGRFSVAGDRQSYQFNVSRALGREPGGTAEVEVALIDRGGGAAPSNAALSIGRAEIVARWIWRVMTAVRTMRAQSGRIALRARSTIAGGAA